MALSVDHCWEPTASSRCISLREICITPFREMLGIYVGYIAARITFVSMSAESSILLIMYIL